MNVMSIPHGGPTAGIAAIEDPAVARRILECLKLPARAPPLGRVTAKPEEPERSAGDWFFDQAPTHEEA
jgi:hypothetical protein